MAYRVEIAKSAQRQLEELYLWVVDRAPRPGQRPGHHGGIAADTPVAGWISGYEHHNGFVNRIITKPKAQSPR